jgi:hypothetical protein
MYFLSDPRLFNIVIMLLFAASAVRWAFAGNYWQALYWSASLVITLAATRTMNG